MAITKKLNRTEVKVLARRILQEVNEINEAYNAALITSPAYLAEVKRIEDQDPLLSLRQDLEKQAKIALGTGVLGKTVELSVHGIAGGSFRKREIEIEKELEDFKLSGLKRIYNTYAYKSYYENKVLNRIEEDITISQITMSDVHMMINTIKATLI